MATKAQQRVDNALHDVNKLLARLERLADKYATLAAEPPEPDESEVDTLSLHVKASVYAVTARQLRTALGTLATKG